MDAVVTEFEDEEGVIGCVSLFVVVWDWDEGFNGNISLTWVIVRVVDSITPSVLSFEVKPDRPNGMRNLTFFAPETIDNLSLPVTCISSGELLVGFCDVV